ncbi:hypothetical protein PAHAL_5G355700 [Panicum hallii]|uniref:Uncharacterized protein n=1 Tax=Panicum hallii TaxID=206008 RepID=A0A2S3HUS5_9POAL|nr:hypothetical protein PAHAL_5G355700 [Panicum hallii]
MCRSIDIRTPSLFCQFISVTLIWHLIMFSGISLNRTLPKSQRAFTPLPLPSGAIVCET